MRKIPEKIEAIFCQRMQTAGIAYPLQQDYRKCLRFYLDFCSKYYLESTDRETPKQFMLKLNEKGQSAEKQKQAYQSIKVYLDIVANDISESDSQKVRGGNDDKTIFLMLERTGWLCTCLSPEVFSIPHIYFREIASLMLYTERTDESRMEET